MDRASLREGGVVSEETVKLWASALDGGEVMYGEDLPSCCRSEARAASDGFECFSCGAVWQAVEVSGDEGCAFMVAEEKEDHRGAA